MDEPRSTTLIVGAGAAGAVLAHRLSASSDETVTLLEAGPDYPGELPPDLVDGTRNSMKRHDWGYHHRPSERGFAMTFPRGRVVGGSSAVNTCIGLRGHAYDYDEWGERGLPEWSFEQCLPAFRRLERDLDFGDAPYHGADGPLPLRRHPEAELATFQRAFIEASLELGFPYCPDSNRPGAIGVGPHAMNKIDGVRMSAARCYLTPAVRARPNLRIVPSASAERVVLVRGRAVAVEATVDGERRRFEADRILVACGAIGTPRLLLASGIGPRAELDRLGVVCAVDLPGVGATLLDHPGLACFYEPRHRDLVKTDDPLIQTVLRYDPVRGRPGEMQLQAGSFVPVGIDLPVVSLMLSIGKPESPGGTVRFEDLRPDTKPRIDSRFLTSDEDVRKAADAIALFEELIDTRVMRPLVRPLLPSRAGYRDAKAIERWMRRQLGSGYHPCGTARMGAADDPLAVTDGLGRVRDVTGLHVVDASLFPTVPSSNTHLPTLMLAERLAELLAR